MRRDVYVVEIEFTSPLLGSHAPNNSYFTLRRISELEKEIKKLEKELERISKRRKNKTESEEEKVLLEKIEKLKKERSELVKEVGDKGENRITVFPRNGKGNPIIYAYQLLGALKETAKDYFKDVKNARNLITKYFWIEPREIELYEYVDGERAIIDQVDDVYERPLRAWNQGLQSYVTTIVASEMINPPAFLEFRLEVYGAGELHPFDQKKIEDLLFFAGKMEGLLQWRSGGYGRFRLVKFEKVE